MAVMDITSKQDGGVLKEIIKEGVGDETPSSGNNVTVHYTGTLLDGTKFDSSKDRNEPFTFDLGKKRVIKAWDLGVATMKRGEIAMFTCHPDYAYGEAGSPPTIPPNATLKFEIEMIDWSGEDLSPNKDKSIEKFEITPGKNYASPADGGLVDVHITGKYNDRVFQDIDVQFVLGEGEGEEHNIVEGIEIALTHFKMNETSKLKIKSKYAFKKEGKPEFDIPPNADLEYIVHLKNFEKPANLMSMNYEQLLQQAELFKEKGTKFYKANKYNLAIKMYKKIGDALGFADSQEDKTEINRLMLSQHLNLSLCYLKTNENAKAKDSCNSALELSPNNEKALFRRGQAYLALASPDLALKDFEEVVKLEPKNTAAAKQIIICNNLIKKQLAKEKRLYANMFEKFAQEDKQKEEEELRQQPDVMHGTLGEWGQEERPGGRDATAFEKENPNILMLNANGTGEFQNM